MAAVCGSSGVRSFLRRRLPRNPILRMVKLSVLILLVCNQWPSVSESPSGGAGTFAGYARHPTPQAYNSIQYDAAHSPGKSVLPTGSLDIQFFHVMGFRRKYACFPLIRRRIFCSREIYFRPEPFFKYNDAGVDTTQPLEGQSDPVSPVCRNLKRRNGAARCRLLPAPALFPGGRRYLSVWPVGSRAGDRYLYRRSGRVP